MDKNEIRVILNIIKAKMDYQESLFKAINSCSIPSFWGNNLKGFSSILDKRMGSVTGNSMVKLKGNLTAIVKGKAIESIDSIINNDEEGKDFSEEVFGKNEVVDMNHVQLIIFQKGEENNEENSFIFVISEGKSDDIEFINFKKGK